MKRTLPLLFLAVMIVSTIGTAEANSGHGKKKKSATSEQTITAQTGAAIPATDVKREKKQADTEPPLVTKPGPISAGPPVALHLTRADSRRFDLRSLPQTQPIPRQRVEPAESQGGKLVPLPDPYHSRWRRGSTRSRSTVCREGA